jgi:hypothetical protein
MPGQKPSHIAWVVQDPRNEDGQAQWREVGIVFPHRNGGGFDIILHNQFSISGRIVCTEPREREPAEPNTAPLRQRSPRREPS